MSRSDKKRSPRGERIYNRLRQWSESETPRRTRVSAQDVLDRHEARRSRRAEKSERRQHRHWSVYASSGILVAAVITVAVSGTISPTSRSEEIKSLQGQVSSSRQQLEALPASDQARRNVTDVEKAADAVVSLQNEYWGWRTSTDTKDETRAQRIHSDLGKHLPEAAAVRWYAPLVPNGDGTYSPMGADRYSWERTTVYEVRQAGKVPVMWLCKDSEGTLLAWVQASWDPVTKRFIEVRSGVTSQGNAHLVSDDTAHVNGTENGGAA